MMGRHEGTKKWKGSAGRAAMWLLLPPLLVLIVLKTDFLPQVARCK
jgi:protein O-mannose beta-1,4-N-acetylglucosaminyltransferase